MEMWTMGRAFYQRKSWDPEGPKSISPSTFVINLYIQIQMIEIICYGKEFENGILFTQRLAMERALYLPKALCKECDILKRRQQFIFSTLKCVYKTE